MERVQAVRAQRVVGVPRVLDIGRGARHREHVPELGVRVAEAGAVVPRADQVVNIGPALLRFGRIVASEIEVPILLVNLV